MAEEKTPTNLFSTKNLLLGVAVVVIVAAVGAAAYFYAQYYQAQQLLKNPTLAAQQQTQELLSQVGKLIALPKNEVPEQIATVSDATKLKGQPFFANAQNGDKLLIYTTAREAILYRPSENKIIAVGPVNIGQTATPTPSGTVKKITPKPTP